MPIDAVGNNMVPNSSKVDSNVSVRIIMPIDIIHIWVPWFHGSMVPPYFLESGTMEPWNQGSRLHILGSMVPWFHPIFLGWNHGTMEPRFQATHFGFHGSMVPPKNSMSKIKNFVGWNHGTMEPRFQATHLRFHGSMVPPKFC